MDEYRAPYFYISRHLETIIPALFRRIDDVHYERERIPTADNDFLDLDWLRLSPSKPVVIISHGLEGDSHRPYVKGMARTFFSRGYNVVAWNFRGCSGEMNKKARFYHSGATEDLETVLRHVKSEGYTEISLIGFSLGGNLTLKYLGERTPDPIIRNAVTFSVPVDLHASCKKISEPGNLIYAQRFLRNLKKKIRTKASVMPGKLDTAPLAGIRSIMEFDDAYTAPLHGFSGAVDYYQKCSSLQFLKDIRVPTLLINARNDPFLSESCYPFELLAAHPYVKFKAPHRGGHVGFSSFNPHGTYWSELQAAHFVKNS